jgi:hypothetical protein
MLSRSGSISTVRPTARSGSRSTSADTKSPFGSIDDDDAAASFDVSQGEVRQER